MRNRKRALSALLAALIGALPLIPAARAQERAWHFGFGRRQITFPMDEVTSLYIAGYHNDLRITQVLDWCEARALWLDTGGEGVLIIGIDCVALDSGTVAQIRSRLSDIENCAAVNVYATHTHAGPDTLGLWGPVMGDGKNPQYMQNLIDAACDAARDAAASATDGSLYYGAVTTQDMYRDSRLPIVTDENLYQLRFQAHDGSAGVRMLFYGAHAESLRGANTKLSRDYPGLLCDGVTQATGDHAMFLPGAIGGLVMTKELYSADLDAEKNLRLTGERLVDYALSIAPADETALPADMAFVKRSFIVPLDNPAFLLYKSMGILTSQSGPCQSATGTGVITELALLKLGDVVIAFIPGEMFPELVSGQEYGDANPAGKNPRPLSGIAAEYGIDQLLICGLANDELGYIVPPSDFLLNEKRPYLDRVADYKGEDHYEETNSVGPACAACIAEAFEKAVRALQAQ